MFQTQAKRDNSLAAATTAYVDAKGLKGTRDTAARFACVAHYVNTLTSATVFGSIAPVPGSTAGFDSTFATPWLHVDITQGASAVVTAVGMAERIAKPNKVAAPT